MGLDTKTDWLTVSRNVTLTLTCELEERIGPRSTEEYRRSAYEDLKCDLKILFMCNSEVCNPVRLLYFLS
jgi:hypothetical protein